MLRIQQLTFALAALLVTISVSAEKSGIDKSGFNKDVRVQDDLYQAVNGSWLETTKIPSDKSNFGSFTILADEAQESVREIVEDPDAARAASGSIKRKLSDLYSSFMDEEAIEKKGISVLEEDLAEIKKLESTEDVVRLFGKFKYIGVSSPISFYVSQDAKDSTRYLSAVAQGGTSLPDRDYYLQDDEKYIQARTALNKYIAFLLVETGMEAEVAKSAADEIVFVEAQLAAFQWARKDLRDANARYNLTTLDELEATNKNIPWKTFFAAAGVPQITEVNVATPSFFAGLDHLMKVTPVDTWKKYLTYKLVNGMAPALSKGLVDAHFNFNSKELAGIPEQQPRWKRGVNLVAGRGAGDFGCLGEAVGQIYVERHFKPEAKARMDQLVKNLLKAYELSINDLTWMTDETKAKAQAKLAKITPKIGYPNKWKDYSEFTVDADDLYGNIKRSDKVEYERMINKLGKPIDREEWGMTPQTVNAYYNPSKNEIVFPAAILQPPFFNAEADDAVNYGGIGAVIGHEISHGFDDQGSKYDGDGNLTNWWTEKDRFEFEKLTKRLVDQYSEYSPLPGKNVNGQLTLGENIADLSGLSIAYKAYKISLNGKPSPKIDGFTGEQRFFLGWSQAWRRKYRDAEMMRRLLTDPHSPSWYRANGPVINIDAFYEAFNAKPGDALYKAPEERIRIW